MVDKDVHIGAMTTELVKIEVKDLKVGMYVSALDRPWLETKFLLQGFMLENENHIKAVQQQCEYVFIDVSKQEVHVSRYSPRGKGYANEPTPTPKQESRGPRISPKSKGYTKDFLDAAVPPARRSCFDEEIKEAGKVHHQTSVLVKGFMEDVALDRPINAMAAKQAVTNCVNGILNSPDALMLMTQLKNRDEYTSQHSMNVCIFAVALGRHINLTVEELNVLGLCGMMHDMGKMAVPLEILNKPGRFTPEEMEIMKSHSVKGWEILLNTSGIYPEAIDVAHMHHERLDGKGYPRQLNDEHITPFSRIVAIVDLYDAVTSDRVYQKGRSHIEALKILHESAANGHTDPLLTTKFVECLGVYPAGSVVELNTGEVAIVLEVNPRAKLKPRIMILQDSQKNPCNEYVVDLAMTTQSLSIRKVLRPEECGIDLSMYYSNGVFERGLTATE